MAVDCSSSKYDFTGKVALVTGSSSGIGAAIATQLAQYGARVVITGRNEMALSNVATAIYEVSGHQPLEIVGDLLDPSMPSKLINTTLAHFGQLDVLVNNAGMSTSQTIHSPRFLDEFDSVFTVNVRVAFELIHLATPHLEQTRGCVVNISSTASLYPFGLIYSVSKAALDMLTKTAADKLGVKGIRVNSINPGPVVTNFDRFVGHPKAFRKYQKLIGEQVLLDRLGQPEDIANLASFLISDDAANMTGSIVVSDGGMLVKNTNVNPFRIMKVLTKQIWHNLTQPFRRFFA